MTENKKPTALAPLRPSVLGRESAVPAVWHKGDVILDLYEVKDVFWLGAKGLVYRVRHREWDIDLAVKSPRETPFESGKETKDFVEAADGWVGLGLFPHIVSCYYVRMLGGIPRLFLEFVEGSSLHDWILTRKLYEGGKEESLKRILDIAIQFAWGLKHAHEHNLSHEDFKPSSVLLTADGIAKVTGFASARSNAGTHASGVPDQHARGVRTDERGSERGAAQSSTDSPTPAFSSPEQLDSQELSRQRNIWSWAACVLEMFSGEISWRAGELLDLPREDYLKRNVLDDYIPEIPSGLATLFSQCLQTNPAQRPAGMAEIADMLRQIYKQETGSDHPRRLPIQANTRAEDLNNRALSAFDLGNIDEALWLFDEALVLRPQHIEATYNGGLVRWRSGRITDAELVDTLEGLKNSEADHGLIDHLLGRVHLERDDTNAASEVLEDIESVCAESSDTLEALTLRNVGLQTERPLTAFFDDKIYGPNAFTPDGKSLLLTVLGFKIRILDFNAPLSPRYLQGHTQGIYALAISADSRYALTSSEDATIRLWDLRTAECVQIITDEGWIHPNLLAVNAGGTHAVLRFDPWSEQATLQLWDLRAGRRIRDFATTVSEYGEPQSIKAVSISPDSKYVLSGGDYGCVQLWDVSTGKTIRDLKGLWGTVRFVQFSTDGSRCFAANDREVREFDLHSGTCLEVAIVDQHESDSKSSIVTVSADGNYVLFGSSHGELKLWEFNTGRCVRTFQDLSGKPYYEVERYQGFDSVSLSPDGRYLLSGTCGGTFTLWRFQPEYHAPLALSRITFTAEAIDNQAAAEENLANARQAILENRFVEAANYVRAARSVPGYERSAEAVELWTSLYVHLPRTKVKASWHSHEVRGQSLARSISFDADGKYVVFGGHDMELKDVATDKCLRVFEKAVSGNAALSGDARLIMIGGWEHYELWDTESGQLIDKIYSLHEKHVKDIQISVDGKYAASCTEEKVNLWEITPEGPRYLLSTKTDWGELSAVAISSDNKYCVGGTGLSAGVNDCSLRLWALPSGKCVRTFEGYDAGTYALVFSPDNEYFLGGGFDHRLRLWEVATGECVRIFEGHEQPVYSLDISSDGKFALSGSTDQTLRLWEIATGECLRTWEIRTAVIGPVRFTADCKYVLAGTGGSILRVEMLDWELEDRELADWDESARPYLRNFLARHGAAWSEGDFDACLDQLRCAGFGWLRPAGVRRELERMVT